MYKRQKKLSAAHCTCVFKPYTRIRILRDQYSYLQNDVLLDVYKRQSLYNMLDDVEIIGFEDGYKGLMYADYQIMKPADFSGILTQGGTILGTSRQPFKQMRLPDENGLDKVEAMKRCV